MNHLNLFPDDLNSVNPETEEDRAAEDQDEVLEFPAITFQWFRSEISVADADEADQGNEVGQGPEDAEEHQADGCKGDGHADHLNEK